MNTQAILQTDYLDLVFHNRNKQYGGYELRKHYNRRMGFALTAMLAATLTVCAYAMLQPKDVAAAAPPAVVMKEVDLQKIQLPQQELITPPVPPPPPAAPAPTTVFTPPVIVADVRVTVPMPSAQDLVNTNPGNANSAGGGTTPGGTGDKPFAGNTQPPAAPTGNTPVSFAEEMPAFDGYLNKYLVRQLRYPEAARAANVQGKVLVQFVVDETGNITQAKVIRGIGMGCDEEALRVVNAMHRWKPGRQNGHAVKVVLTLPIRFTLQ